MRVNNIIADVFYLDMAKCAWLHAGVMTMYSRGMVNIPPVKLGGISPTIGDGTFLGCGTS